MLKSRGELALALLFMVFSGFSALTYEVTWERLLRIGLGLDIYSSTAAATGFLLGLGFGAYLASRLADRPSNPLFWYSILEMGIAFLGFLSPLMLRIAIPSMGALDSLPGSWGWLGMPIKLLSSTIIIGLPTSLMGATLPILIRSCISKREHVGLGSGILYGANTLGAVFGIFIAGFYLIGAAGLAPTIHFAATLNLAVGISALVLALKSSQNRQEASHAPKETQMEAETIADSQLFRRSLLAYTFSGMLSLGYEILCFQAVGLPQRGSAYTFAFILGCFLIGLAAGGVFGGSLSQRFPRKAAEAFSWIQIGVAFSLIAAVFIIGHWKWIPFETVLGDYLEEIGAGLAQGRIHIVFPGWDFWIGLLGPFIMVAGPAFFFGAAFPLANQMGIRSLKRLGGQIGLLLAGNTAGAVAGGLLMTLVGLPLLHMAGSFTFVLIGCLLLALLVHPPKRKRVAFASVVVLILFFTARPDDFVTAFLTPASIVDYEEGITGVASLQQENSSGENPEYAFKINGSPNGRYMDPPQWWRALKGFMPALLHPHPERVFYVGIGGGTAAGALALFEEVRTLDAIEISKECITMASRYPQYNFDLTRRKKVRIHWGDARTYLRRSPPKSYDIIASEALSYEISGSGFVTSREFYQLVASRLRDRGLFCFMTGATDETAAIFAATFRNSFPFMIYFDNIYIGSLSPIHLDGELVRERLANNPVVERFIDKNAPSWMRRFGGNLPAEDRLVGMLFANFKRNENSYRAIDGLAPLARDEHPINEFTLTLWYPKLRRAWKNRRVADFGHLVTGVSEVTQKALSDLAASRR